MSQSIRLRWTIMLVAALLFASYTVHKTYGDTDSYMDAIDGLIKFIDARGSSDLFDHFGITDYVPTIIFHLSSSVSICYGYIYWSSLRGSDMFRHIC